MTNPSTNVDSGISIVIPTYNVSKYIEQCIKSLLNQTFDEYEIICVDNGSTDNTVEILNRYASADNRVRVMEVPHQTAGDARNAGMDEAKNKYLLFLDGDDFFEQDMLRNTYERAENDDAQICLFDARNYYENDTYEKYDRSYLKRDYIPESLPFSGKNNQYIFEMATAHPWNKLFNRKFVVGSSVRFQSIKRCNDVVFVFSLISLADRITVDDNVYVHYRQHNESLQGTVDEAPCDWIDAYAELRRILTDRGVYDQYRSGFQNICLAVTWHNFTIIKEYSSYKMICDRLITSGIVKLDLEEMSEDSIYEYNTYSYELITNMQKMSPEEILWQESHRMVGNLHMDISHKNEELNRFKCEIEHMSRSLSYRLGRSITLPARTLRRIIH